MPLAEGCNGELCNDVTYISTLIESGLLYSGGYVASRTK